MADTVELSDNERSSLEAMIANAVQSALKNTATHDATQEDNAQERPEAVPVAPTAPAGMPTPLEQMITPYLQHANLQAAATNDKADFYSDHAIVNDGDEDEDAGTISRSMRKDIEKNFADRLKAGRPESRENIYAYLLGKNIAKVKESAAKRSEKRKAAETATARSGFDVGASGGSQSLSVDQMWNMELEKMSQSIADTTF